VFKSMLERDRLEAEQRFVNAHAAHEQEVASLNSTILELTNAVEIAVAETGPLRAADDQLKTNLADCMKVRLDDAPDRLPQPSLYCAAV